MYFENMSPEEERTFEKEVMRKIADLALIPPKINTDPLPEYDYDRLDYGMNLSIERTVGGRLWAAWVAGEDGPRAFMVVATSEDNGETWSKPCLVIDSQSATIPRPRSVIVGNLWLDPMDRLWFFFDQTMQHFDGRGGLWAIVCQDPDAKNPKWSTPRRIWHGSMLNKPIVIKNGDWLLPVQLLSQPKGMGPFSDIFPELDQYRGANVLISKDNGKNFERLAKVDFPYPNWYEHMITEREDGSLWMLARTSKGIMESISKDGGENWSNPDVPKHICHPVSRFHIRKLASGRILMVTHGEEIDDPTPKRHKLKAFLSEDDGHTWKGGLMLDDRDNVSYPDGTQAEDGTIYISYDRERAELGEILMARITEEDILAGELLKSGSKLKVLISRPLNK